MSKIERLSIKDGDEEYTVYVESKTDPELLEGVFDEETDEDEPVYRGGTPIVNLQKVHAQIRTYAKYAIGAFQNLGGAEVEELNLKFGLKIGGKTGIPILTEGSAESNFENQVKCKFRKQP